MKITNLLFVLAFFMLTACGGDDNIVNPDATLIGTWELEEFSVDMTTSTEFSGQTTEAVINLEGKDLDYELTFSETAYTTAGSYGYAGSMEVDGNKSSLDESVSNVTGNGTYSVADDELTSDGAFFDFEFQGFNFDAVQGEVTAKITKLSDKELIFSEDKEETIDQNQGGVSISVTTKQVSRSVWKRK